MRETGIWEKDVQSLRGIGPKRVLLLKKLGISTAGELLYYFPRDYDDRSRLRTAGEYSSGERAVVKGVVVGGEEKRPRRGLTITRVYIDEGPGRTVAVWYNQPFIRRQMAVGTTVLVTGRVKKFNKEVQIQVDDYEVEGRDGTIHTGGIVPVYPLTEGLSQRQARSIIKAALDQYGDRVDEFIPGDILSRYLLPEVGPALHAIHYPDSPDELKMARRRFIFEELFLHQILFSLVRKKARSENKPHVYPSGDRLEKHFLANLPFSLTPGQAVAWGEISGDMDSPFPMNRLLQGDVGSGKTLVCALAMLKAAGGGFQAALMAPTEILAEQHYINIGKYFGRIGISTALATGGMKKNDRDDLLEKIKSGLVQVVVGTHALIQSDVQFKKLALVVIDEQHRFGVRQRAMIRQKGLNPDVLVMTATPIPRTLAMTMYGDLDISSIKGMPPGRKQVETAVYSHSRAGIVYGQIKNEVSLGRQAYIVCPLVEESEKTDLLAAVELREALAGGPLSGCRVDLLHGRMKSTEKESVMSRFRSGLIDVLVSTTVVEVGVDVPNATVMAIMDAHRFGLAQLHQLRGRVGRGGHPGNCFLIAGAGGQEQALRLEAMKTISDGFELAEKDLELRGPGELLGTRQWGESMYRMANPLRDARALAVAAEEARRLVERDPGFKEPGHRMIARELSSRFGKLAFLNIS